MLQVCTSRCGSPILRVIRVPHVVGLHPNAGNLRQAGIRVRVNEDHVAFPRILHKTVRIIRKLKLALAVRERPFGAPAVRGRAGRGAFLGAAGAQGTVRPLGAAQGDTHRRRRADLAVVCGHGIWKDGIAPFLQQILCTLRQ